MSDRYAPLPEPPYYAVIFTAHRRDARPDDGYDKTAERMGELVAAQPGFLGVEYSTDPEGVEITVSYWRDEASIAAWKANIEHALAQDAGRARWYAGYVIRVARIERAYAFGEGKG
jgi:heme-degrading monooxygenase HmoA